MARDPEFRVHKLVERRLIGRRAQLLNVEWDAGAESDIHERDVVIYLRLDPDTIENVGTIKSEQSQLYGRLMMRTPEGELQTKSVTDGRALVACCRYDPSWLQETVGAEIDWYKFQLVYGLDLHNSDLLWIMRRIARELKSSSHASDMLLESLTNMAAVELLRDRLCQVGELQGNGNSQLDSEQLRSIRNIIETSLPEVPTIAAVAREMRMSYSHLSFLFRNSTGQTLHSYIADIRLDRARAMLKDTQLPLKVISHQLGFSHQSAFSIAFRKALGESPREYRMRMRTLESGPTVTKGPVDDRSGADDDRPHRTDATQHMRSIWN